MPFTVNRTMGTGECPLCLHDKALFKTTKSGLVFIVCPPEHEGGCNTQKFCRGDKASRLAAERVKLWSDKKLRKEFLGTAPTPAPAPEPEEELLDEEELPEEESEEESEEEPEEEPEPEPEPRPARRRAAPPKRPVPWWDEKL